MVQLRSFYRGHEQGQALVEYALIVAVVGACLVFILGFLGKATTRVYQRSAVTLEGKSRGYGATGGTDGIGGSGGTGAILTASGSRREGPTPEVPPPDSTDSDSSDESLDGATTIR